VIDHFSPLQGASLVLSIRRSTDSVTIDRFYNYSAPSTEGANIGGGNNGTDTVRSSVNHTLGNFVENLTLTGTALNGTGNLLNNVLTGSDAISVLTGAGGSDTLYGAGGNDTYQFGRGEGQDRIVESDNTTTGGKVLRDTQVNLLVNAMAAFAPPAVGQTTLSTADQNALNPVIAANWKCAKGSP
jgi:Ca2+-binding RTX toxin-like protein